MYYNDLFLLTASTSSTFILETRLELLYLIFLLYRLRLYSSELILLSSELSTNKKLLIIES